MAYHAELFAEAEGKAKTHGFHDRIPKTSAVYPGPLGEDLLNMRELVRCFCCCCFSFVFFFSFVISMTDDVSVTGCVFQVPYPDVVDFDPTTPGGVCAAFEALRVPEQEFDEDEGDHVVPPVVAAMSAALRGDDDANIYDRLFPVGLPTLKGTHHDTITDLPIRLQKEITEVTDILTASCRSRKMYRVRVQRVVLVCVRSFHFVCVCFIV